MGAVGAAHGFDSRTVHVMLADWTESVGGATVTLFAWIVNGITWIAVFYCTYCSVTLRHSSKRLRGICGDQAERLNARIKLKINDHEIFSCHVRDIKVIAHNGSWVEGEPVDVLSFKGEPVRVVRDTWIALEFEETQEGTDSDHVG